MLNSFLQFLEQDVSDSVIVATSNLPEHLDRALYRRFDATLDYPMPTGAIAKQVIRARLASLDLRAVDWRGVSTAAKGLSHSEVTAAAEQAAKDSILAGTLQVRTDFLVEALRWRNRSDSPPE